VHPLVFRIGKLALYSYSLMVVAAFAASALYVYYEAGRLREDKERAVDLGIYVFISAFVGARLLHILVEWRIYLHDPVRIFKIWEGGLVYYGGFILAILVIIIYVRKHHLDLKKWADLWAPVAMIALVFGRIGCFLNGCCYGTIAPSWLPWKVVYPAGTLPPGMDRLPLHPAPIYEAAAAGIILAFLIRRSRRKKFEGEIAWLMIFLYAAARFFLEFVRADERGGIGLLHLSTSQLLSIFFFILSGFFLARNYLRPAVREPGN